MPFNLQFVDRPGRMGTGWFAGISCFLLLAASLQGKPTLTSFSPRCVQVDTTTEITASGTFETWPVRVWVNRPGLEIKPGAKGKLSVKTSASTIPGIYLVRFLDDTGASQAIPLVVDSIQAVVASEPNESPSQPQVIKIPANVSGVLAKGGDVDCFQVECTKGQVLVARMMANPLFGTTMDGVLQICNQRGFVMDQNDDRHGIDPSLFLEIPQDGTYYVRTFAFPAAPNSSIGFAGGSDYRYLLTVSNGPVFEFPVPLSDKHNSAKDAGTGKNLQSKLGILKKDLPDKQAIFYTVGAAGFFMLERGEDTVPLVNETRPDRSEPLKAPFEYAGSISQKGERDLVSFQGIKGKKMRFQIDARKHGMDLDPALDIFDKTGKSLAKKDDNSKTDPDLSLDFAPPQDGVYYLKIRDAADQGGSRYFYRLRAKPVVPDFRLSLSQSSFETTVNKKLEMEVTVSRLDGFNLPIDILIQGLPGEVKVTPQKSEPKGDSSKKIKIVVESSKAFQAECRVTGSAGELKRVAECSIPSGQRVRRIFLTASKPAKK